MLRAGGLVAFPTETVYGLGAAALDAAAVRRIYEAKGRPSFNPLIVHVAEPAQARLVAAEWPEVAERLAAAFWPGPLTMVLPKRPEVPDDVTAGLASVAVRVPAHPVALALLRAAGIPVAAPSANRFTEISPTRAAHVAKGLAGRVDLLLDGGETGVGIESTVIDLTGARPRLLRPGTIAPDEIERVVGGIERASAEPAGDVPRPSPGMVERHYAPRAEVRLFDASDARAAATEWRELASRGRRVGALVRSREARTAMETSTMAGAELLVVAMPEDPAGYARALYAALHDLDEHCDVILVERVPAGGEWDGVRDRIERASR